MKKIGIMMELPESPRPSFFSQIVKSLAAKTMLFDRDKELLIVDNDADRQAAEEVLTHYHVPYSAMELLLLPEQAVVTRAFTDYGFTSRSDNRYLYLSMVSCFRLAGNDASSERQQALQQLDEHLIAEYAADVRDPLYIVDSQLEPLMEGIARAYGCTVEFITF